MKLSMKWLAAAVLVLAPLSAPEPADACGVKLTVKGSAHKKGVARTSNPSDVLLVGSPPRRLSRDLSAAGHRVEVAPNPGAAKRTSYAVVITDSAQADEVRTKYGSGNTVILVRSGDVVADMRTVEKTVARKPVAVADSRDPIKTSENRPPIAAGPIQPKREIVTTAEPKETTQPPPETKQIETKPVETKPAETKPVETKPAPEVVASKTVDTKHPTVKPKTVSSKQEVYFSLNSAESNGATLAGVVKWLQGSPDVQVVIEGHADPTGDPAKNMTLSERRANWVRDELVAAGIDATRIEVKAFGSTALKYGRTDSRNRRVAIVPK